MYKLILVDDEEDVREGLLDEISWEEHGFEVLDKAENGREAIELIERYHPDVVVTDIQMPFMNGLELAEWIRINVPNTKIIILTGFDEFEYAQKAIKMQIDEYVLKPFSAQELVDVLLKVKGILDEELADQANLHNLLQHYRKSLPIMKGKFLSSLVTRRLSIEEINEKSVSYELNLKASLYMVSIVRVDYFNAELQQMVHPPMQLTSQESLKDTKDRQLQLFAVFNIANEICLKHKIGEVFLHHDDVVLLMMMDDQDLHPQKELPEILQILDEVRQNVEKYLKLTVTIGAGTITNNLENINFSYHDALQALDYRLLLGNNRVIWIDDVESRAEQYKLEPLQYDELNQQMLIRSIKVGTAQEVRHMVETLFAGQEMLHLSVKDCHVYVLEILTSIMKIAKEFRMELDELLASKDYFAEFTKFNNLDEVECWIAGICVKLMNHISKGRQSSYNQLVNDAKAYIAIHYQENDISINTVCKHLHISTGYFSGIFKKEVKMTFVNYLMHLRMEQAKDLLRSSQLRTFEIAEQVGFIDPNYFSFCFRKRFGISPKEYRNNIGEAVTSED
ncbi:response regulator [Paenibacillus crassostreae]|uniref:Two-component system response regulator n=1 Tax=Paenibacillus crassostreae TaxID=1763538 RepID=A0A167DMV8_9BACL|nr:response regulator [Paenibacillus crassostreae]AOZ91269.1 DNA-binding response regulator [Paenibacillus crassostreae]OAB74571.1 two-component system response regulator [Paenibacillus crassostreae]